MAKAKFGPAIKPIEAEPDEKEPELTVDRVLRSLQPDPYIPPSPTQGWMLRELELLGQPMRGKDFKDQELARMLRAHGYDVTGQGRKKPSDQEKDR